MDPALSERKIPSKRLPRVARRWDIPPIVERQTPVPVILEGVRSKIVKTPAGERVLWGNRQGTIAFEEALVWAGAEPAHFHGLAESVKLLNKAIPLIQQLALNMASRGADGRGLIDLAKNLSSLTKLQIRIGFESSLITAPQLIRAHVHPVRHAGMLTQFFVSLLGVFVRSSGARSTGMKIKIATFQSSRYIAARACLATV